MLRAAVNGWLNAYRGLPRDAWILSIATLVNRSGTMVLPYLSLYLLFERKIDPDTAGTIQSCYGLGALPGSFAGGWLSDRIGTTTVQVASLVLGGFGFVLVGLMQEIWAIGAALFLQGAIYEMLRPANAAALAHATTPALRTQAMALNRIAINLGTAAGMLFGGWLVDTGFHLIFWIDGATSIAAGLLLACALARRPVATSAVAPLPPSESPLRDRHFLWLLLLLLPTCLVFFAGDTVMVPYLRSGYGLSGETIGRVCSLNQILIVAFEMLLVKRLSRRAPLPLIALGTAFTCAGFALFPWGRTAWFALLPVLVFTIGEMLVSPFLSGFVASRGDERRRGRYLGLYMLTWAVAFALAPKIWFSVFEHAGPAAPFHVCAVLGALLPLGFLALARSIARERSAAPAQ